MNKNTTLKGWECPNCSKIHAPTVEGCACKQNEMARKTKAEELWGANHEERMRLLREFHEKSNAQAERHHEQQPPWEYPIPQRPQIWLVPVYKSPLWPPYTVTCGDAR